MASFNGNVDLLALNGAQVMTGIGGKDDKRPYICIPADVNEIKIEASKNDQSKMMAKLRVNIWPLNDAYKNKVRQSAMERGDTNINVPTHEMQISFSIDYIKAVIKAYPALVQQVKDANKERSPQIVDQNPEDENTQLFKLIQRRMNKRLANLYQHIAQPAQPGYPQQPMASVMGGAAVYTPPTDGANDYSSMPGYNDPDSDLPF